MLISILKFYDLNKLSEYIYKIIKYYNLFFFMQNRYYGLFILLSRYIIFNNSETTGLNSNENTST